jgi:hypothetical protein
MLPGSADRLSSRPCTYLPLELWQTISEALVEQRDDDAVLQLGQTCRALHSGLLPQRWPGYGRLLQRRITEARRAPLRAPTLAGPSLGQRFTQAAASGHLHHVRSLNLANLWLSPQELWRIHSALAGLHAAPQGAALQSLNLSGLRLTEDLRPGHSHQEGVLWPALHSLNVGDAELLGNLPALLAAAPALRSLDLSYRSDVDTRVLLELGRLTQLQRLNLSSTRPYPRLDDGIQLLVNLQVLDVRDAGLPLQWGTLLRSRLTALHTLRIDGHDCHQDTMGCSLADFSALRALHLTDVYLDSPTVARLAEVQQLTALHLRDEPHHAPRLDGPRAKQLVEGLTRLRSLTLFHPASAGLQALVQLTDLKSLRLDSNSGRLWDTTAADLAVLRALPVRELALQGLCSTAQVSPLPLRRVTALRWTDGATFPDLQTFPSLRRIEVDALGCAPLDIRAFESLQRVPQLTSLRLEGLRMTESMDLAGNHAPKGDATNPQQAAVLASTAVGEVLGQLPQLRDLGLTYLFDLRLEALVHLSKLSHLSQLNCDGSPFLICSAAMPYVAGAQQLENLHLVNDLYDPVPAPEGSVPPAELPPPYADTDVLALLQLPRLRSLHISYKALPPNMSHSVRQTLRETLHSLHIVEE